MINDINSYLNYNYTKRQMEFALGGLVYKMITLSSFNRYFGNNPL